MCRELNGVLFKDNCQIFEGLGAAEGYKVVLVAGESTCQCRGHKRDKFDPWVRKNSWKGNDYPF